MGSCQSVHVANRDETRLSLRLSAEASKDVYSVYTFGKVIDKGSAGIVYQVRDRKSGEAFACKTINKVGLTEGELDELKNEIRVLRHLGPHQHIVGVVDVYEDRSSIHMIMQLCSGGELFQRLASRPRLSESEAAKCLYTVMRVVQHCHAMNVVHRGIQPENFLLETSDCPLWCLRAIDFGSSCFARDDEKLTDVVGSPHYVAPEVLRGSYHIECDIWSAGVMLYILLSGRPPFDGENDEQVLKRILSAPLDIRSGVWQKISESAKDLVKAMLSRNPRRRLTADEVLAHEWMCAHVEGARQAAGAPELLVRMQEFARMTPVHKKALRVCASRLPTETVTNMRSLFNSIDRDQDGCVTLGELIRALRKRGARKLSVEQVDALLHQMNTSTDHKLQFDEFLAATMHNSIVEKGAILLEVFKHYDSEGDGLVNKATLEEVLAQTGYLAPSECSHQLHPELVAQLANVTLSANALSQSTLSALLASMELPADGPIPYQSFCGAFFARLRRSFPTWTNSTGGAVSKSNSGQNLSRLGTQRTGSDSSTGNLMDLFTRGSKPRRRSLLSTATYPKDPVTSDAVEGRAMSCHAIDKLPQREDSSDAPILPRITLAPGMLGSHGSHDVHTITPASTTPHTPERSSPVRKSPLGASSGSYNSRTILPPVFTTHPHHQQQGSYVSSSASSARSGGGGAGERSSPRLVGGSLLRVSHGPHDSLNGGVEHRADVFLGSGVHEELHDMPFLVDGGSKRTSRTSPKTPWDFPVLSDRESKGSVGG